MSSAVPSADSGWKAGAASEHDEANPNVSERNPTLVEQIANRAERNPNRNPDFASPD
jgi:hypothetical protein